MDALDEVWGGSAMDLDDPLSEDPGAVTLGRQWADPLLLGGDVDQEHEEACLAATVVGQSLDSKRARQVQSDEIDRGGLVPNLAGECRVALEPLGEPWLVHIPSRGAH